MKGRASILVVEDCEINQQVAEQMLIAMGYNAFTAENGLEALVMMGQQTFDAILMDCQMPKMDGYEATRAIRRNEAAAGGKHTPIIALTAHALVDDAAICRAAGMDDYISKPYTGEILAATLKRWVPPVTDTTEQSAVGAVDSGPG